MNLSSGDVVANRREGWSGLVESLVDENRCFVRRLGRRPNGQRYPSVLQVYWNFQKKASV